MLSSRRCRSSGAFPAKAPASTRCVSKFARLAEILIDESRVAVAPGTPFGVSGFMRLSFATSMERLERGLDRIEACVAALA